MKSISTIICLLSLISASAQAQMTAEDIFSAASPATATITTDIASGSGVTIDSSGIIVTNVHVIEGASSVEIALPNGDRYDSVQVIEYDYKKDIVILKIPAFDLSSATIGNSNDISIGQNVFAIGSPRGLDQSITTGIISSVRDVGDGFYMIQTDAAISAGSSGGGLFNDKGELIGITTSTFSDSQNINFAVPINYVRGLFSTVPKYTLDEFQRSIDKAIKPTTANVRLYCLPEKHGGILSYEIVFDPSQTNTRANILYNYNQGSTQFSAEISVSQISYELRSVNYYTGRNSGMAMRDTRVWRINRADLTVDFSTLTERNGITLSDRTELLTCELYQAKENRI